MMLSILESSGLLLLLVGLIVIGGSLLLVCTLRQADTHQQIGSAPALYPVIERGYMPDYAPLARLDVPLHGLNSAPPLTAQPPTCFTAPDGGYTCLGEVINHSQQTQHHVRVAVDGINAQRQPYHHTTALEQRAILPQHSAAYRVSFPPSAGAIREARARVISAIPSSVAAPMFDVDEATGILTESGQYRVQTIIRNRSQQVIPASRLIVMLRDVDGRIVGYRVFSHSQPLAPGAAIPLDLRLTPFVITTQLSHEIFVETH